MLLDVLGVYVPSHRDFTAPYFFERPCLAFWCHPFSYKPFLSDFSSWSGGLLGLFLLLDPKHFFPVL